MTTMSNEEEAAVDVPVDELGEGIINEEGYLEVTVETPMSATGANKLVLLHEKRDGQWVLFKIVGAPEDDVDAEQAADWMADKLPALKARYAAQTAEIAYYETRIKALKAKRNRTQNYMDWVNDRYKSLIEPWVADRLAESSKKSFVRGLLTFGFRTVGGTTKYNEDCNPHSLVFVVNTFDIAEYLTMKSGWMDAAIGIAVSGGEVDAKTAKKTIIETMVENGVMVVSPKEEKFYVE